MSSIKECLVDVDEEFGSLVNLILNSNRRACLLRRELSAAAQKLSIEQVFNFFEIGISNEIVLGILCRRVVNLPSAPAPLLRLAIDYCPYGWSILEKVLSERLSALGG